MPESSVLYITLFSLLCAVYPKHIMDFIESVRNKTVSGMIIDGLVLSLELALGAYWLLKLAGLL